MIKNVRHAFRPIQWLAVFAIALPVSPATPPLETLKNEAREIVRAHATLTQQMVADFAAVMTHGRIAAFDEPETIRRDLAELYLGAAA